jgi:rhamnulose-1-phosphate aldolase
MHTETAFFIPEGVGYVGMEIPGSQELAKATLKSLKNHKVVVWEKHGCLAVGKDVHDAFDRIDLMAKAARIYLMTQP